MSLAPDLRHVFGTRVVAYSYASAVAFLIYDILLTIPDEVRYIWPNPTSITKVVFFFIRYFPPMLELSTQFYGAPLPQDYSSRACYVWNVYQGLAAILVVISVDYILILRAFAMYPRNRPIRIIALVLYATEICTMSVGAALSIPDMIFDEHCAVISSPMAFTIAAGSPILYQTFLFVLIVVKFYQSIRAGWGRVPILRLLMRDGTWAFFLLFALLVSEALLYGIAPGTYTGICYGWVNTAYSVCGYRILINLNKLHHEERYLTYDTGPDIVFTSRIEMTQFTEPPCMGVSVSTV